MSERKHVKVFMPASSRDAWIEIDGVRQKGVRAISVRCEVGQATSVTLELVNVDVEIEADVDAPIGKMIEATHLESSHREWRRV